MIKMVQMFDFVSTNPTSIDVNQYRDQSKACIYFSEKCFYRGAMLKGKIEVLGAIGLGLLRRQL